MNTYTWKIAALDVAKSQDGRTDVVVGVHYTVDCADEQDSIGAYGSVGLDAPGVDFTSFPSLTEDTVLSWAKGKLDVPQIETQLAQALELKKNPPVVQPPLPWAPASAE